MDIDTSTWMMIFFLISLVVSIWKIYAFLPNKELEDDDRNEESHNELKSLMLHIIQETEGKLDEKELFFTMSKDERFNSELFWRFNLNRLKQLLHNYYMEFENVSTIKDIYERESA